MTDDQKRIEKIREEIEKCIPGYDGNHYFLLAHIDAQAEKLKLADAQITSLREALDWIANFKSDERHGQMMEAEAEQALAKLKGK